MEKSSSDVEKQSEVEVKREVNISEIKPALQQVSGSFKILLAFFICSYFIPLYYFRIYG